jgi:hypothetical protein
MAERGGSQLVAETDSAANHYGQLRAENPRPISVFAALFCPSHFYRISAQESDYEHF